MLAVVHHCRNTWHAYASQSWPSTIASVRYCNQGEKYGVRKDRSHVLHGNELVVYQYAVDHVVYTGNQVDFEDFKPEERTIGPEEWLRFAAKAHLRADSDILVRYNPDRPSLSVIRPGVYWPGALFMLGLMLAILGWTSLVFLIMLRPPPQELIDRVAQAEAAQAHPGNGTA